MKRVFLLTILFIFTILAPFVSFALPSSCSELGNILRSEITNASKLQLTYDAWGVGECDSVNGHIMCFECPGGLAHTVINPKTGSGSVKSGCPCKSGK